MTGAPTPDPTVRTGLAARLAALDGPLGDLLRDVDAWDVRVVDAATDLTRAHPALHEALVTWQACTQPGWMALGTAAVGAWAWRRHGLGAQALRASAAVLATWGAGNLVKHVVHRARPLLDEALTTSPGSSFPSGHSFAAAAAGTAVVLLLRPVQGPRARAATLAGAGVMCLVTGTDRVLLGMHHPTDVLAGWAFGATAVGLAHLIPVGTHSPGARADA